MTRGKPRGPVCPTCGKGMALDRKQRDAEYRAKTAEQRRAYQHWYYHNVEKPRRAARNHGEGHGDG